MANFYGSAFAAAFIIFALSVFETAASAALAKTGGAPRATAPGLAGRPGADLVEEDALFLLEDQFDETLSLGDDFLVSEGVVAGESAPALLAMAGKRATDDAVNPQMLGSFLNILTLCLVVSGALRFYNERIVAKSTASVTALDARSRVKFQDISEAIRQDDAERLQKMLERGHAVSQVRDAYGCSLLHVAAHHGSVACLRVLLAQGVQLDVNSQDAWDETPLHFAARQGNAAACELLLARGASLNAMNSNDEAPLMAAGKAGKAAICDLLLERGAVVGDREDVDIPPVLSAALFCRMLNVA
eukprot:TRINITY_DN75667_c0_g1_i1.p1 TRINITY_DN75667_c0_g1~~TRINITY_DN75667_c0_g1_i1.p1  ORF type:complete len:331 (+),score=57.27 TRINITY_DN75667_c0_g1_i1:88-993(+)